MSHHPWGSPEQPAQSNPWAKNPWQQPAPQQPARRKHLRTIILSGAALLVLVIGAWVIHTVLERTVFSPQATAEAYLQAIVDGEAEEALALLGPNVTDQERQLATTQIYQETTARPDQFEITAVEQHNGSAHVQAELVQSGKAYPLSLELTQDGTIGFFFSDWTLESGDVSGRVYYASGPAALQVNGIETLIEPIPGVEPETSDEEVALESEAVIQLATESGMVLLPGTYSFRAADPDVTLSPDQQLELTITPGEIADVALVLMLEDTSAPEDPAPSEEIDPPEELTEPEDTIEPEDIREVLAEATHSIEQRLDACVADTHIRVADCEVASWEDLSWGAMTDIRRRWEWPPEVVIEPAYDHVEDFDLTTYDGPLVARIYDGTIAITYQVRDYEDEEWSQDLELVYAPFETYTGAPFELPVTRDGDEVVVDYSPLDELNHDWVKPERRD